MAFRHSYILYFCRSHKVYKSYVFSRNVVFYRLFGLINKSSVRVATLLIYSTLKIEYSFTLQNNRSVKPNSKYAKMQLDVN